MTEDVVGWVVNAAGATTGAATMGEVARGAAAADITGGVGTLAGVLMSGARGSRGSRGG